MLAPRTLLSAYGASVLKALEGFCSLTLPTPLHSNSFHKNTNLGAVDLNQLERGSFESTWAIVLNQLWRGSFEPTWMR